MGRIRAKTGNKPKIWVFRDGLTAPIPCRLTTAKMTKTVLTLCVCASGKLKRESENTSESLNFRHLTDLRVAVFQDPY